MSDNQGFSKGLAGVIADSTSVSQVQGDAGRLIYRGVPIEELAEGATFEEAAYFLLYGWLPTAAELGQFTRQMKEARSLPGNVQRQIPLFSPSAHPMAVLQSVVAALSCEEPPVNLKDVAGHRNASLVIVSQLATAVACISRHRRGLTPLAPRMDLSHASNFLYMLQGTVPPADEARMFEKALILHMDHDFNASTFAARVVGSTEARLLSSLSAAIGALSGPLHGGANEKVLEMADAIGSPGAAREWVLGALASKAKVMGFGHRVYRTMDPRAKVLRAMLDTLVAKRSGNVTVDILRNVHDTMISELSKKEKDYIWPNVDFWSGALYRMLDIETIDFTPIFAVARVVGWCAHVNEMWTDNRIYRPAALYVGPAEARWVDLARRTSKSA